MKDENLEDIVFDRLCRYLKPFGVEIKFDDPYFEFRVRIDDKLFHYPLWISKKEVLMGFECGEDSQKIRMSSIFTIFDEVGSNARRGRLFQVGVKVQQYLDAVKADSYEEMLLKMDMIGI